MINGKDTEDIKVNGNKVISFILFVCLVRGIKKNWMIEIEILLCNYCTLKKWGNGNKIIM